MKTKNLRPHFFSCMLLIAAFATFQETCSGDDQAAKAGSPQMSPPGNATPAAGAASDAGSSSAAGPSTNRPPIKGGVQKVELSLEKLRDVGLDLKHTLKAVSGLYDEVTIQPVTLITEPEIVGPGVIINLPIGTRPTGPPQPARKDRVDLEMNAMRPMINLLKTNTDEFMSGQLELDLPDQVLAELKPETQKWVATVDNLAGQLAQLNQLTQGPPYDQQGIAAMATDMQKSIKQLDQTRRKIYKVIRKEGKKIAALRKQEASDKGS
jgi:hypothetical protein